MSITLPHGRSVLLAASLSCVLTTCTVATAGEEDADAWSSSRLGRTKLGEVWDGPEVAKEDLRGNVVLLEFWGYRCGPCIAAIPHVSKINAKYRKGGLVVIGSHAQGDRGDAKALAIAIAKRRKANYTITARARVPDANFRGIPHAFVFDHTGKVVYEGHPAQRKMEQAIAACLKRRPHPLLGEMKYKALRAAAASAKAGRLGEAWKVCEANKDAEGDAGKEAAFLQANLRRHAERLKGRAEKCRAESPTACTEALEKLRRQFLGSQYGQEADEKLKELAKDEQFQKEAQVEKRYVVIARAMRQVPPCPADQAAKASWLRRYRSGVKQIRSRVQKLKSDFPDSRFVQAAEQRLEELAGQG